ncbi:hypothetical protein WOLCODRAFT_15996 [Wolfiporia cocos MD-104 SS10]|uniref:Uncharacterized protein n=1 Tax=Wolfiporia cocos (strain MD-104) TaxID=742152 RepID=A0A2H3J8X9_WOLCO|nr:hypothetical protein WOLCODRAFT_15996 [Wolfiporia cocos MD-104 SS10]
MHARRAHRYSSKIWAGIDVHEGGSVDRVVHGASTEDNEMNGDGNGISIALVPAELLEEMCNIHRQGASNIHFGLAVTTHQRPIVIGKPSRSDNAGYPDIQPSHTPSRTRQTTAMGTMYLSVPPDVTNRIITRGLSRVGVVYQDVKSERGVKVGVRFSSA